MAQAVPMDWTVPMKIEVVYATPTEQKIVVLELDSNATVLDAVKQSGLAEQFSDIEVGVTPVGIYGDRVQYDMVLHDADRVEIYRPLEVDPMEARRLRAVSQSKARGTAKSE